MAYNFNVKARHETVSKSAQKTSRELRKRIGGILFSEIDREDYHIARKIYERITSIDMEFLVSISGYSAISETINKEYRTILAMERENEQLRRDLEYFKKLHNIGKPKD